jgi:hypothetical protein
MRSLVLTALKPTPALGQARISFSMGIRFLKDIIAVSWAQFAVGGRTLLATKYGTRTVTLRF